MSADSSGRSLVAADFVEEVFGSVVGDTTAAKYADLDPDVRLMLAVRDDNAQAFEELVNRYQNRLITILHHHVGDRDRAEDLAQEVFLRIFRARKKYQPTARFATWLFTIANNVASNARRTLARRREVQVQQKATDSRPQLTLEEMAKVASGQMPARRVAKSEMAEVVQLAMRSLNERQRMAVLLCKFEGMSYADIASAMNMSAPAIKSLLSRARGNLKDILEPYLKAGTRPTNGAGN